MAQTVSGFKGWVDQSGEARRFAMLATPVVENAAAFKPTSTGTRTIRLAAGRGLCCGIDYRETATQDIVLPANAGSDYRFDVIGLRFTWTETGGTVAPFSRQGTPGSSSSPTPTRTPGDVFEWPLALVRVRAGVTTIATADVYDLRVWGGVGGPYISGQAAPLENAGRMAIAQGAEVMVGASRYQATAVTDAGFVTWTLLEAQTAAWKAFVPNLRNSNGTLVTATAFYKDGRYRLENGMCRFKVRLGLSGTIGGWSNADGTPYTLDLPVKVGSKLTDQWVEMSVRYPSWPWMPGKLLLRAGATRGLLYVAADPDDVRIRVMNGRPDVVTIDGSYLI